MQTIDGEIVNQYPMPTQASTSTAVAVAPTPLHVPQNAVALNFSNMPAQYKAAQGSSHLMDNAVAGIERFTLYKIVPRAGTLVLQSGSMVLDTPRPYYDVIFLGVSKLTRVYYANKFDANQPENVPPTCGSDDSVVPSPHVPVGNIPKFFNSITQQMETVTRCDQCPMSKKTANGMSDCRLRKAAAVVLSDDPTGAIFSLGISSTSIFGKDNADGRLPFQQLMAQLRDNNIDLAKLVIRVSASFTSSFPQTRYTAIAVIPENDFGFFAQRAQEPIIDKIVNTTVYEMDTSDERAVSAPAQQTARPTPPSAPAGHPIADIVVSRMEGNNKQVWQQWLAGLPANMPENDILREMAKRMPQEVAQAQQQYMQQQQAQQQVQQFAPRPAAPQPQGQQNGYQPNQQQNTGASQPVSGYNVGPVSEAQVSSGIAGQQTPPQNYSQNSNAAPQAQQAGAPHHTQASAAGGVTGVPAGSQQNQPPSYPTDASSGTFNAAAGSAGNQNTGAFSTANGSTGSQNAGAFSTAVGYNGNQQLPPDPTVGAIPGAGMGNTQSPVYSAPQPASGVPNGAAPVAPNGQGANGIMNGVFGTVDFSNMQEWDK